MIDGGASRVAEPEEAGHLVEGLAGGIVDGPAQQPVATGRGDLDDQGVTTGDEQGGRRPLEVGPLEQ